MKNKKVLLISIISVVVVAIGIGITLLIINNRKDNEKKNNIVASEMEKIVVLSSDDSAKSAELIKKNIVKITNQIDENTKIVGTGFFHESGYLVTNSHIVDIKGKLSIEYYDGTSTEATLVSNDITSDIALLYVEDAKVLAMSFGNTLQLNVTDEVYGIGYAYALEGEASVSKGILSARRTAGGIEFLQSDLALNTGNSGGPLINAKGELLGINTYATENASIAMSISSESLEIIIDKLIEEKKVNYLEKEREANALSVVLKEIGYEVEDIYEEYDIIKKKFHKDEEEKHDNKHESNGGASNNNANSGGHTGNDIVDNTKSGNSRLSTLTVAGYPFNFNPDGLSYCILLRNSNATSLNINAVAQESESRITIKNNKVESGKSNQVSIEVMAPNNRNGHTYDIYAIRSKDTLAPGRLSKINVYPFLEYVASKGGNYYKIYWDYTDRDGVVINADTNNITSIVSSYTVDVYVDGLIINETEFGIEETREKRLVKSYSFNGTSVDHDIYTGPCGIMRETAYISINEIRQLLSDTDYHSDLNQAAITFKVTLNTYHQGIITGDTWLWLNK